MKLLALQNSSALFTKKLAKSFNFIQMSKMINTVIRTHSVELGCPSHLACNIGMLVGIYADIEAKELLLFYDHAGDLVQQQ